MFVGHLAVALASKRIRPSASLGWYVGAATTADLIWPVLVILGVEQVRIVPGATAFNPLVFDSYPWSHSLLMLCLWAGALMVLARWRGVERSAAWLIAALVLSHWVLDYVTHAPDMPLWPGASSPHLGLGLWNSIVATYVVEGAMWFASIALFLRGRRPTGKRGPVLFWSLVGITTVMWALAPEGPPPTSALALGWFALIGWIMIPWAWGADRGYAKATA